MYIFSLFKPKVKVHIYSVHYNVRLGDVKIETLDIWHFCLENDLIKSLIKIDAL